MKPPEYRRNLPHFLPDDAPYFVTTRLHDSIPLPILQQLRLRREIAQARTESLEVSKTNSEKVYFRDWDRYLDTAESGPTWLKEDSIAGIVEHSIRQLQTENQIEALAWTIMPNHIHLLFDLCEGSKPLYEIMGLLKGRSAYAANKLLNRSGAFWQEESYDHVVRHGELGRIAEYIILNPVKAGIVRNWRDHRWTYLHSRFEGL